MHFNAKWIGYETGEYKGIEDRYGNPAPYFRKTFSCKGKVKKAEILASALGVYKIYVNGKAASDDYFSPGWVDYSKKLPFVRFDITELLTSENAVGIVANMAGDQLFGTGAALCCPEKFVLVRAGDVS